jgi:DNA-binding NarL/FixJ family response regulator
MVLGSIQFSLLFKDSDVHEVAACLDEAEQGRQYICMKAKSWLYEKERDAVSDMPQLTMTEKEVLRSLTLGKTTKEIAAERFLSVYTVMTHRKNIFRKLNVNNAQEAIRYALRAGIVNVAEYCI